jgi:hypothetical protein
MLALFYIEHTNESFVLCFISMLYIERTSDHIEHINELHLKASKKKLFTAKHFI